MPAPGPVDAASRAPANRSSVPPTPPGPAHWVQRIPFHIAAEAAKSAASNPPMARHGGDVEVPANVTAMVLELRWNGTVYDLDPILSLKAKSARLTDPAAEAQALQDYYVNGGDDGIYWNQNGHLGAPDSPAAIAVKASSYATYASTCAQQGCAWNIDFLVKDVAVDVGGELALTLFAGQDIPAGYSGFSG
jgi:hypothetical protein